MKLRGWWTLAGALFPLVAVAWLPLSHRYPAATVTMQLGDLCDTARFPATPGSCAGDASNPDWRAEFQVAVDAYDTSSCLPRSTLPNPVYGDATLWAGPGPLRLKIRFRDEEFSTDLLLVDWMLPDQSGLELTRAVKRNKDTEDLPVIMLTAKGEETCSGISPNDGVVLADVLFGQVCPKIRPVRAVKVGIRMTRLRIVSLDCSAAVISINAEVWLIEN